jgi:ribosomal protein S18 acetylase RimI-like enzyme
MPEIEIRPTLAEDIPFLIKIDHNYISDHVWQIELENTSREIKALMNFRQVRLPRPTKVEYPKSPKALLEDWDSRSDILVARYQQKCVGYISLSLEKLPNTTWVTDLVVDEFFRRKGIGTALVLSALDWAYQFETSSLVLEMQPKNFPAIQFAIKLGFELNGFYNNYYANNDIGLFFRKAL